MAEARRTLRRKKLHLKNTLNAYEQRIRSKSQSEMDSLEGAWLSSYDTWDTVLAENIESEYSLRFETKLDNNAFRLFEIAKDRGVNVTGITSERQANSIYIAEIPVAGGRVVSNIVFCGNLNSFTKRSTSTFSILSQDKRYYNHTDEDV